MEITVTPKKWYVVSGAAGSTISTPEGVVIATVPDGGQASFYATTYTVEASDDSTEVVEATFKYAPAKLKALGVFGRGVASDFPSGYLSALFLEGTGAQYVNPQINTATDSFRMRWTTNPLIGEKGWVFNGYYETGNTLQAYVSGGSDQPAYAAGMGYAALSPGAPGLTLEAYSGRKMIECGVDYNAGQVFLNDQTRAITRRPSENLPFYLFARYLDGEAMASRAGMRLYSFVSYGPETPRNLVPAINITGEPVLFDKRSKSDYKKIGNVNFIVGMTAAQACKLGDLPADATTKKLTVSLPASIVSGSTVTDTTVQAALDAAAAKGWTITIQTYTE